MLLWLSWVAAHGLGGLISFPIGGAMVVGGAQVAEALWPNTGPRPLPAMIMMLAVFACWPLSAGVGVAAAEWIVLRVVIVDVSFRAWVRNVALLWLGGATAAVLAIYAIEMLPRASRPGDGSLVEPIVGGLLLGVIVGAGQFAMLGHTSSRAWIWPIATPVSYALGAWLGAEAANLIPSSLRSYDWTEYLVAGPAIAGLVGGAVSGTVTGAALAWMVIEPPRTRDT
jgi:hypothetical protein